MLEKSCRPREFEMRNNIERVKHAREVEQDALGIVRAFNARLSTKRSAGFRPTVATAINAKHPWLVILCESCGGVTDLDLRVKPRDPEASIRVALRDMRCPRCNGHGRPRIAGLARGPSI